ncbi:iron-sulfur protein [Streptomyces lucensis JCM 4490]|uniref:Cytochrome bc1 complex Rieske iron-sulfur subunit n=1 Tax=Streptomyces lucensis JCM 4490 TaxID=1306176 RepID=A0A918MRU8_9ACTN|nr:Rieske (2Fe-2S) protein [Streptomyces lucensis]GGW48726.1 iron-sulfur protein [Streptomyces lucensis JCM 4490]
MTQPATRRTVLATGAAALAAGCVGCGGDNGSGSSGGTKLTAVSDIPEGGGKVFRDQKVVVTQPAKGEFRAFSAICTHEGCTVDQVADGTIDCPCHGSRFHIADGSVAHGPATRPLPKKSIKVEGNSILLT